MGTDKQKWHYRTVKNLSRSFQEITSKSKLESHGSFCKNYDYCHLKNAWGNSKILKYNQDQTSMNVPYVFDADTESLLHQIHVMKNC